MSTQNPADAALEALIDAAFSLMLEAQDPDTARVHFSEMSALIAKRSPQAVFRMECERRLGVSA